MQRPLILLFTFLFCSCSSVNGSHPGESASVSPNEPFVFAVWIHGNAGRPDGEWRTELSRLAGSGISDLFVGAGADELRRMVRLGDDAGLRIHGWVWTVNRPGDKEAMQHPEWYAVNREGKNSLEYRAYVNYYQWLSPFSDGARQHIAKNITEIADVQGLASVHLDYVRYCDVILATGLQPRYDLVQLEELPQFDYGYHPEARRQYEELYGVDPLTMEHPELSHEWRQLRLNAMTDLVNELAGIVHARGVKISAAVFPFPEMSRQMVRQDWDKWELDMFLPMIYHSFYEKDLGWIGFCTRQGVRDLKGRADLYSGLYLPSLTPQQLEDAVRECRSQGAAGVSMFSSGSLTDDHLRRIDQLRREFGNSFASSSVQIP